MKSGSSTLSSRFKSHFRKLFFERLEDRRVLAGTVLISEFLTSNSDGLRDEDGESSDWIELYNPTSSAVNLSGWRLTDSPGDLNQWQFPSVNIEPNQYLLVFASGKDRAVAGQELHANFRLSSAGEFLALVNSSNIIVSQFSPSFPQQATNVSYGPRFSTQTLVEVGSDAKTLVPTNDSLGNTWSLPSFNDTLWTSTPVGIGFGIQEPGFEVTYYKANIEVDHLDTALNVIANPNLVAQQVVERVPVINYLGTGSGGNFGNDLPFPTQQIGDDYNDFVVRATGTIIVPSTGNWTFGVNSDDGFRLIISRDGVNYTSEFPWPRAPANTLATFSLPQAGEYSVELIMYERAGGASVEFFAAPGSFNSFHSSFRLVGDTLGGGLNAFTGLVAGPNSSLRTDISAMMQSINSSVYTRIPFQLTDASDVQSLSLRMRYNDGFVAYLNGVEVARRNAPSTLAHSSAATSARTMQETGQVETINLSEFVSALVNGSNVLAIHGLNVSASDSTFLMVPELIASKVFVSDLRYFAEPTPGGPNSEPFLGLVGQPVFSVAAGFYDSVQSVAISTDRLTATIRYTLNGSQPTTTNGFIYTAPILVGQTTTIRAIAYEPEYVTLPTVTRSYLYVDDIIHQSANGAPPPGWPSSWGPNVVDYGMDPRIINWEGAEVVKNALKAIPSLNIAIDLPHLFDAATGIYANASQDGRDWERPASLELIQPDGSSGFQVNAGLRIRGGFSRSSQNPKHSFRLFFRGQYGDATLEYPLAGPDATSSFKKIDLRTAQNYSWSFGGDASNNFVAEVYNRLSQQAMGMPSTSSQWYHLYLNGVYWGIFQTQERAEHEFAATYFGGLPADYDVIKVEAGPYTIYATSGQLDAWEELWTSLGQNAAGSSTPLVANNAEYLRLQGKNPDGSDNPDLDVLLDVDNLITYMIGILYGGNLDAPISNFLGNNRPNNFYAIRNRMGREGFKFFQHDGEHTLRNVNQNRNGPWPAGNQFQYSNPQWFHQRLMSNAEYRMRFADLVQRHLFNGGALTVASNQARFLGEASVLDQAIYAESARWGDAKRPNDPLRRSHWVNAVNGVVNNYFPARNDIFINQLRNTTWNGTTLARLFPTLDAPAFLVNGQTQHGGLIQSGSQLRFSSPPGAVYYTLDGSDPRLWGGGINPDALSYVPGTTTQQLFTANSTWKYFDQGINLGTTWRSTSYNDSSWASGVGEFGYGDGDEATVVSFGPNPSNKYITTYFRKNFQVTNLADITALTLQLKRDDGAVVYINGVEAVRSNMPSGTITFSTLASSVVGGADESTFFPIQLNPALLNEGNNLIAVEIHQVSPTSSDKSFDAALSVTRQTAPSIPMGILPETYRARTRSPSGEWSAMIEATFSTPLVPANESNLFVTEVHYNPAPFTGENANQPPFNNAQNFEFIELRNLSQDIILLDGVSFFGITYTFPSSSQGPQMWLEPGELVVVVKQQTAFAARYQQPGSPYLGIKIAPGDYGTSNLSNGGERIDVIAADQSIIQSFTYDDENGWPTSPDGGGYSLTPIFMDKSLYNNPANWRASFVLHGTPGIEENDPPIANAGGPYTTQIGVPQTLNGSAIDPDWGQTLTYEWDLNYNGSVFKPDVTGASPTVSFMQAFPLREIALRVTDDDTPPLSHLVVTTLTVSSQVEAAYIFHKDSQFATGGNVSAALDTTKSLALETATEQTLTFDNLINSSRGINGLVFDINKLSVASLSAGDFEFRMSPQGSFNEAVNPPHLWQLAPTASSISVQPGEVDRVILEWPNGAIMNRWLRVAVLANANTGLAEMQVYYVGHLLGETTGPTDGVFSVSFADITPIRFGVGQNSGVGDILDIDKSGTVTFSDISAMRGNVGVQLTNITVASAQGAGSGGGSDGPMSIPASTANYGNTLQTGELLKLAPERPSAAPIVLSGSSLAFAFSPVSFDRKLIEETCSLALASTLPNKSIREWLPVQQSSQEHRSTRTIGHFKLNNLDLMKKVDTTSRLHAVDRFFELLETLV